jgi:hypothetical protein
MSRKKEKGAETSRRDFLRIAGIGTVTGGAALAVGGELASAKEARADGSLGYRETEHVKTYYKLARF